MAKLNLNPVKGVTFDEISHTYLCGDKVLVGITTLMKHQGISPNYNGIPEATLLDAATRGTSVHELFEGYEQGLPVCGADVYSEITEGKLLQTADEQNKLLKAYKKLGLNVAEVEWMVSDHECVASMIDLVLADGSVVDIKTSAEFHADAVAYQLSFYAYLLEKDNPGFKVPHLYGLHARNGQCKLIEVNRIDNEVIEEYLAAEKMGDIFEELPQTLPSASVVLSEKDIVVLSQSLDLIRGYEELIKSEEGKIATIKDNLYQYMLDNNLSEIEAGHYTIFLKRPYEKVALDSKVLKSNYPDIYEECCKTSMVKGNITFKSK